MKYLLSLISLVFCLSVSSQEEIDSEELTVKYKEKLQTIEGYMKIISSSFVSEEMKKNVIVIMSRKK